MIKKAKVIFLGDTGVGKSCIISAVNGNQISTMHQPTIGMDFSIKIHKKRQQQYKLQIWDTAGQQKFRSIMPSFIRNSKIAIIVYDITCQSSFENIDKWVELFQQSAAELCKLVVVGNKVDLKEQRKIPLQKAKQKIGTICSTKYLQISAKSKQGINELLDQIVEILQRMDMPEIKDTKVSLKSKLKQMGKKQFKRCCQLG